MFTVATIDDQISNNKIPTLSLFFLLFENPQITQLPTFSNLYELVYDFAPPTDLVFDSLEEFSSEYENLFYKIKS